MSYYGWSNYETWLLRLNLDNDEGTYTMCKEWFKDVDKSSVYISRIADNFKEYLEEVFYIEEYGIYKISDVWTERDWNEIDWIEITKSYLEEKE